MAPPEPFPKKELSEKNLILTYCTGASSSLLVAYIVWVSVVPLLGLRRGGCTVRYCCRYFPISL